MTAARSGARPRRSQRKARELPYVTLKAAITLDGRIAASSGHSKWISGEASRKQAHKLRAQSDAIVVGVGTVLADDPELTVRHVRGKNPLRVVLDSRLRTPLISQVARVSAKAQTLVLHGAAAPKSRRKALQQAGVELAEIPVAASGKLDLHAALRTLAARGLARVLVEGGSEIHGALLDAGLADRVVLFVAPKLIADARALPLAAGCAKASMAEAVALGPFKVRRLGPDLMIEAEVLRSRTRRTRSALDPADVRSYAVTRRRTDRQAVAEK